MGDWSPASPMGTAIYELRAANVASKRVRGNRPGPGDAKGPGEYQRFVVLVDLGGPPLHRTPLQWKRLGVNAYGVTDQDAEALYLECFFVFDNAGPRYGPNGVAIHQSLDDTGGDSDSDPITKQPVYRGVFLIAVGAQALAS